MIHAFLHQWSSVYENRHCKPQPRNWPRPLPRKSQSLQPPPCGLVDEGNGWTVAASQPTAAGPDVVEEPLEHTPAAQRPQAMQCPKAQLRDIWAMCLWPCLVTCLTMVSVTSSRGRGRLAGSGAWRSLFCWCCRLLPSLVLAPCNYHAGILKSLNTLNEILFDGLNVERW